MESETVHLEKEIPNLETTVLNVGGWVFGVSKWWFYLSKKKSQVFFPKATAKGSLEKSTTIKDCRSDRCLERLSSKTTEVIRVLKDCHQRLPK